MRFYLSYLITLACLLAFSTVASDQELVSEVDVNSLPIMGLSEKTNITNVQEKNFLQSIKLRIFPETTMGLNLDNGKKIKLRKILIETPWGISPVGQLAKISQEPPRRLELVLSDLNGVDHYLKLPSKQTEKLRRYLLYGAPSKPFDCASFAHYMLDIPFEFASFENDHWNAAQASPETFYPGAVVAIGSSSYFSRKKITHFSIYLGDGLFISKFGVFGTLVITNLEEMKKAFGGKYVFMLEPKLSSNRTIALNTHVLTTQSLKSPKV
ncbi:MAG: C40 family peptidase [Bdellovibrionales bacterium]|nr:C40 family peptidase [Bdellovibrionales bacterium]